MAEIERHWKVQGSLWEGRQISPRCDDVVMVIRQRHNFSNDVAVYLTMLQTSHILADLPTDLPTFPQFPWTFRVSQSLSHSQRISKGRQNHQGSSDVVKGAVTLSRGRRRQGGGDVVKGAATSLRGP